MPKHEQRTTLWRRNDDTLTPTAALAAFVREFFDGFRAVAAHSGTWTDGDAYDGTFYLDAGDRAYSLTCSPEGLWTVRT